MTNCPQDPNRGRPVDRENPLADVEGAREVLRSDAAREGKEECEVTLEFLRD